jgi:peptidoglycan/xylan/chitin deacetylase (PgdA/CDA1 family)
VLVDTNQFNWKPVAYDTNKQYIYLTFDDGPQVGTAACVELCKRLGVKATFFMVGLHAAKKSDGKKIVRNIKYAYPQLLLANHSYSHAYGKYQYFYRHPYMADSDFNRVQTSLAIPYKIIRLPGNSAWVRKNEIKATSLVKPVCRILDSTGYNVVGWDAEWNFNHKTAYPKQKPQTIANAIEQAFAENKTHVRNHLVLLAHDRMFRLPNFTDSLAKLITILKQNPKYVFETADHYPNLKMP